MKLSYEDKLTIYKLKKQGMTWTKIGKIYDVLVVLFNFKISQMISQYDWFDSQL